MVNESVFSYPAVVLLAIAAVGCGSVVVDDRGASSESATGSGGASAGSGAPSSSTGSASSGTGGSADCTAPKVTVLASKQWHPGAIALDAANVYWANAGAPGESSPITHVFSAPKAGGTPVEIATTKGSLYSVLVDDARVYWMVHDDTVPPGSGLIYAMPKAGGPVTKVFTSKSHYLFSLTMDEARFYWENGKGQIVSVSKSGGDTTVLAENAQSGQANGIVISQDSVYWKQVDDTLMSTPKLGGASQAVTDLHVVDGSFAVDDAHAFWVAGFTAGGVSGAVVFSAPKSGGEPVEIVHDPDGAYDLHQFGPCLYWASSFFSPSPTSFGPGWELRAAPKSGGAPIALFYQENSTIFHYAVDASGVYWVDRASGTVMKATK